MIRTRMAALALLLLVLLTGCWNRREMETLGFALATGIDWDEQGEMFEVTVQLAKPQALSKEAPGGGGVAGQPAYWVFTARGRTVFEAVRNITKVAPRKVWWGHNQVLVLSESVARRGVLPALDFTVRDGETRRLFWVLITPGKARAILSLEPRSARIGALGLLELIRARGATSTSATVKMHDFTIMLSAPMAATTGVVKAAERGPGTGPSADYDLEGAAVFAKDRLIGYLDDVETRGMLWVQGKVKSAIITVPCQGEPNELVGLEVVHASARIEPRLENGRPAVTVVIGEEANLGDKTCRARVETPEGFSRLETAQREKIKSEVDAALRRARDLGADVFGFGVRIQQEMPAVWRRVEKDWDRQFRTLPVDLRIEAKVRRQGLQSGTPPPR